MLLLLSSSLLFVVDCSSSNCILLLFIGGTTKNKVARHGRRDRSAEGAEKRDAEGVKGGGEWRGGIPLPSRLGGLGERRKLPQRGPPAENDLYCFFGVT